MTTLVEQTLLPDTAVGGTDEHELRSLLTVLRETGNLTLTAGESSARVPDQLRQLLDSALSNLITGTAVSITPHRTQLTTQEAADLLGVSRPTLIRLIDAGEIPCTRPGRHRRIRLADVLAYQSAVRDRRSHALADLAEPEEVDSDASGFVATR